MLKAASHRKTIVFVNNIQKKSKQPKSTNTLECLQEGSFTI